MEVFEQLSKAIGPLSAIFAAVIVILFRKMAKNEAEATAKLEVMWQARLADWEKRHEEQSAKVRLLLTALGKHTEARLEPDEPK